MPIDSVAACAAVEKPAAGVGGGVATVGGATTWVTAGMAAACVGAAAWMPEEGALGLTLVPEEDALGLTLAPEEGALGLTPLPTESVRGVPLDTAPVDVTAAATT